MTDTQNASDADARRGARFQSAVDRIALIQALAPARAPIVTALSFFMLLDTLTPAATALVLGRLVGRLDTSSATDVFRSALVPLALFGVILLVGHIAEGAIQPLSFLATARIDGAHRTMVARLAASTARIDRLERASVQGLLREVAADPSRGYEATPATGAIALLRWTAGMVGAVASCAVLAQFAWWLVPLVLVPALINRAIRNRQSFELAGLWRLATRQELPVDIWRRAATSPGEGKDIRIFGFADWMVRQMQGHIEQANRPLWRYTNRVIRDQWSQFLLVAAGLVPTYAVVTASAANGGTSIALLTATLAAGWSVYQALASNWDLFAMAGSTTLLRSTAQLRDELDDPATERRAAPPPLLTEGLPPPIVLENIEFRYPGADRSVLNGLDLEIRPGELLAIVGLNGAGKSTLIKLVAGLYRPTAGRILVDGQDIEDLGLDEWRSRMSVVFQDLVRYQLPVQDNVTLGQARVAPDGTALAEAAAEAGMEDLVAGFPRGWETPLSRGRTDGVDLSGGQWQQVALARALYGVRTGARLLILDEPTAHLDVQTEFDVFNRLSRQRGKVSAVLISHRLSTVRQADRIVLLDGGRITESGSHDELMARGGSYAEMFEIQAQRFRAGYDDRVQEGAPR